MTKLTVVNNTNKTEQSTHKAGNFYISTYGNIYILAVVDIDKVCLINTAGTRWKAAYEVECISNITEREFSGITDGHKFTKIDSVTITIN